MEAKKIVQCNCCGKEFTVNEIEKTIIEKEFLHIHKQWGYFSRKDGMIHEFDICEECYDRWLENFVIPPENRKATELM